ncbi:amino acid adenylation domain-containing protein [Ectopseudomonas mendocina]|uniref:Amino acid adenylation domain-containing protein n=1 Tax=Ectopseudomonas mendocina TaxID=300 RepID=A0ABZ2RLC5_ECTME
MKELTTMQAACWMGREGHAALGGVSAHLYAEFENDVADVGRLRQALHRLYELHPMLRMQVTAQGTQRITPQLPEVPLEIEDLRSASADEVQQRLAQIRQHWTHQKLDLARGQAARWCLSMLPGERCRLHVDTDMVAIDPSSFRVMIEDLARLCEDPDAPLVPTANYFDWLDKVRSDSELKAARDAGRQWWRERLAQVAPAPSLPLNQAISGPRSERYSAWLSAPRRQALQQLARQQRLSLSQLMLGLFACVLAGMTGDRAFRLNVPSFWRAPLVPEVERIVGEFANVLILDVDLDQAQSLAELCQQLAANLLELLQHSAYSGVSVMRDLSRFSGTAQLAPVVFTAALDLPTGELFSERVKQQLGALSWVVSQGPQVALDAQLACADGGILINWDVRLDALPQPWVNNLFDAFVALVSEVADDPERLNQPLPAAPVRTPLNTLQQAYLFGRSEQMALGGVAMQEFREYRGPIDPELLQQRLTALVKRHDSLRTRIDAAQREQYVSAEVQVNFDQIDLRELTPAAARTRVDELRDEYAHGLFHLSRSPWNVTLFRMPGTEQVVFVRFDALILDGRSIAALLVELFEGRAPEVPAPSVETAPVDSNLARKADAAYWKAKLADVTGAPRLPWKMPLEQMGAARFARQSLRVTKQVFNTACRAGAKQRLFKNSTLMAVLLDVLSHWLDEGDLCVAVPVAVPSAGAFANRSTFIAVNWQVHQASFAERAATLQSDVLEGLEHLAFSGVDLGRTLFESNGPGPVLPVVITNGFSWPHVSAESPMKLYGGLTQTPQVAMDIRFCADANGDLLIDIDYVRQALDAGVIADLLAAFEQALQQLANSTAFDLHSAAFIDRRHYRLNSSPHEASSEPFLSRIAANLFDPENHRTALISGGQRLSYAQLGSSVARVMAAFEARGLSRGSVVAVCLPRSPEHTQITLACALSGIIWVPVDACAPQERREYLLQNCNPDLVVLREGEQVVQPFAHTTELLAQPAPIPPLEHLHALSLSEDAAYYLYTSGTTGRPKCVVLNNRATANVIGSTLSNWGVTADDVFISVTPLHHDMSVFDVFGSLSAGATLVLPGVGEEKDAVRWNQLVTEHGVTLWCSVPAILEMLLACRSGNSLSSLRLIAQGGDYIKPAVISELRQLLPRARLISLGGPTETTIWSIWHEITSDDRDGIPYGHPLPGNRYLLLDERGEHCPAGVVGRIHTAGVNLALGYLDQGQLLQTDFIPVEDEHGQPVRAFRTGDCGYYRADGTLIFARRVNGYVKVRGVRVSLPDVEMALLGHPALQHALVVDYGDQHNGDTCLGALYVCREPVTQAQLREHARHCLAQSHVPSRFVVVDALPLTANGKPDRNRARQLLSAPPAAEPVTPKPIQADAGLQPSQVLDIYLSVLGQPPGARPQESTDFVSLGLRPSHLKAISARLREVLSVDVSPAQLLRWRNAQDAETYLQQYLGNQIG